jgi:hypothetical protein
LTGIPEKQILRALAYMILNIHTVETATREEILSDCKDHIRGFKFSIQKENAVFELLGRYDIKELRNIWEHYYSKEE